MADYDVILKYRKDQLNSIETVLKKVAELTAFIKVYGALYDNYYYSLILNINNISEHYLQNLNAELIDRLYDIYCTSKEENKDEKEIFEQLREILYKLPSTTITEVSNRRARHKIIKFQ